MQKLTNYLSVLGIVTIGAVVTFFSLNAPQVPSGKKQASINEAIVPEPVIEPVFEFGLRVDTLKVIEEKIKPNEFVSQILSRYNVDNQTIHTLSERSAETFDFRKFKAGNNYTILASNEADTNAHYLVYEKNPIEYVVYNLKDPEDIKTGERPVTKKTRTVSGSINSSLWNTLVDLKADPDLAVKLAMVYQWTVDFTRIQAGDTFNVVYDDVYVDGEFYRSDSVKAAYLNHGGKDLYAFYYDQGEGKQAGFYDENGISMKRAFLKAPVKYSRISSRYTKRRFHPVQKRYKAHLGTDYAASYGTPIVATADGTITKRSYTRGNGNYVKIRHNGTYSTQYLHMSKFKGGLSVGSRVSQGDIIGYVGSTGLATGPHVCYRFWKNNKQIDPLQMDFPAGDPIEDDLMPKFEEQKQLLLAMLNSENPQQEDPVNSEVVTVASILP